MVRSKLSLFALQAWAWRYWRGDVLGGLTAAIVSLPLALSFGVASGLGAVAGLYGAIIVGLVAALFGGTATLISEPTGPMTVIMTSIVATMLAANPEQGIAMAFTVVMLAGLLQVVFGLLGLGRYVSIMPYSVISGFMSGIGVILILLQLPAMLGHPSPAGGVLATLRVLPALLLEIHYAELALALVALLILLKTPKLWRRYVPPALLALLLGSVLAWLFTTLWPQLALRRVGSISLALPRLTVPTFSLWQWRSMLVDAAVLAMLGSIDTLLTAMISDSLTRREHNPDKELVGQGLANFAAGLLGGLPGAGATMGTVINIRSGAHSALSGVMRALLLLAVALGAGRWTAQVPLAVLAAIAFYVGFNILDWSFMRRAHVISKRSSLVMYGVLLLTVFVDLIVAVAVGVFIANILTIERLSAYQDSQVRAINDADDDLLLEPQEQRWLEAARGQVLLVYLSGPLIFGVSKAIARQHAAIANCQTVVFDLSNVPMLDVTVSLAIENAIKDAVEAGKQVLIVSNREEIHDRFKRLGIFAYLPSQALCTQRREALQRACAPHIADIAQPEQQAALPV